MIYMDMCFVQGVCIAAILTNHTSWNIRSYKHKNCVVLCMKFTCLIDWNMWFANYLLCQEVGSRQYASEYMDCRLFPVLYGPLPSVSNPLYIAWLCCTHTLYVIVIYIHSRSRIPLLLHYTEYEAKPWIMLITKITYY